MTDVYVLTHPCCVAVLFSVRGRRGLLSLVPDSFARIKDDHHVADILVSVSETARLIAVCCHAAWPSELLSLVCTTMCIFYHARAAMSNLLSLF
jgi:hypothetical protein